MEYRDFVPRREAIIAVLFMGITGFLCGLLCGYGLGSRKHGDTETHTTVDTIRDTVPSRMPAPIDSMQTGVIRIPIVLPSEPNIPKATVKVYNPDSLFSDNTASDLQKRGNFASKDTSWITIPRTQKKYVDSTYTAWVSGYEPRLDSIYVYRKTIRITERQVVTKRNAFSLGIIGGVGYGVFSRKPDVFVGIGGSIKIW